MSHHHHTQHAGHHTGDHGGHADHGSSGLNAMAISATLHCLTGCAIGEVLGLIIGTALGLAAGWTIALAVGLAFLFGYALSTLPLLSAGLGLGAALSVVLAADTLSILTMEVVDNAVMALVPGAMDAGLVNPVFWLSMSLALTVAFFAAWPVNRILIARGKGHALTHEYHHGGGHGDGHGDGHASSRRRIPAPSTGMLVTAIVAFMLGGLVVATAAELEGDDVEDPAPAHAAA